MLGSLLRHFTLQLVSAAAPEMDSYIIPIRPLNGLHVLVRPRAVGAAAGF